MGSADPVRARSAAEEARVGRTSTSLRRALRRLELSGLEAVACGAGSEEALGRLCREASTMLRAECAVAVRSTMGEWRGIGGLALDAAVLLAAERAGAVAERGGVGPVLAAAGATGRCWAAVVRDGAGDVRAVLVVPAERLGHFGRAVIGTLVRIGELAIAQEARTAGLKEAAARFDVALERMSQGLCFFDGSARLVFANRRYAEMYALDPESIRPGMSLGDILALRIAAGSGPAMSADRYLEWRDTIRMDDFPSQTVVELTNGRVMEVHHQPTPDRGWVATHDDITARRQAEARVAHMARHDALTGLANRALLQERIQQALRSRLAGRMSAVLCLDLDRFKPVNDSLGHHAGDQLLQAVAGRLARCVRETDTVARLGGDEFAILVSDLEGVERVAQLAGQIIRSLSEPYGLSEAVVTIGASIGIALDGRYGSSAAELLKHADIALYQAKGEEAGGFRFYEPAMESRLQARLKLEAELRVALAEQQFEVFYQPLIDLERGTVSAFEALVRWRHPERGLVLPSEFIGTAEQTGLIVELGGWVLERACLDAAGWPADVTVCVNLSPAQFRSKRLIAAVREALAHSKLPARRLELEITESILLDEGPATLAVLKELNRLGIRISMDDFGTGYSSLGYLRSFPFDKIKIDQSFVRDLSEREDAVAIIRAIVGLGKSLKMLTIAEGVETEQQLAQLREEGCDEVQGFLFGRPRPASDVPHMIQEGFERDAGAAARPVKPEPRSTAAGAAPIRRATAVPAKAQRFRAVGRDQAGRPMNLAKAANVASET